MVADNRATVLHCNLRCPAITRSHASAHVQVEIQQQPTGISIQEELRPCSGDQEQVLDRSSVDNMKARFSNSFCFNEPSFGTWNRLTKAETSLNSGPGLCQICVSLLKVPKEGLSRHVSKMDAADGKATVTQAAWTMLEQFRTIQEFGCWQCCSAVLHQKVGSV